MSVRFAIKFVTRAAVGIGTHRYTLFSRLKTIAALEAVHCRDLTANVTAATADAKSEASDTLQRSMSNVSKQYSAESIEILCADLEARLKINRQSPNDFVPRAVCYQIVSLLLRSKVTGSDITDLLSKNYALLSYPISIWEETIAFLKIYQFNPQQMLQLICHEPSLLQGTAKKPLFYTLAYLRSIGIGEGKMQQIVAKNPKVIQKNISHIQQRYNDLLKIFTKAEVLSLLLSNPSLMTDSWGNIQMKIDYLYNDMGIKSGEIVKSLVFERSYGHIFARHQFLVRTGSYKKPTKHDAHLKSENLSLKDIVNSSNVVFVNKVGSLSVDEYESFVKMTDIEIEDAADSDADSSESDSDESDTDLH